MESSAYKVLNDNWNITKKALQGLGINPDKEWDDVTVSELGKIAGHMDITVGDLF